jgi:hypothetical protein
MLNWFSPPAVANLKRRSRSKSIHSRFRARCVSTQTVDAHKTVSGEKPKTDTGNIQFRIKLSLFPLLAQLPLPLLFERVPDLGSWNDSSWHQHSTLYRRTPLPIKLVSKKAIRTKIPHIKYIDKYIDQFTVSICKLSMSISHIIDWRRCWRLKRSIERAIIPELMMGEQWKI